MASGSRGVLAGQYPLPSPAHTPACSRPISPLIPNRNVLYVRSEDASAEEGLQHEDPCQMASSADDRSWAKK